MKHCVCVFVKQGVLRNGKNIAVKKLFTSVTDDGTSEKQLEKELLNLMKVKYKNIVRIVGYCFDTLREVVPHEEGHVLADIRKRFLCLEYIPNKSLKEYLEGMTAALLCAAFVSSVSYL